MAVLAHTVGGLVVSVNEYRTYSDMKDYEQ